MVKILQDNEVQEAIQKLMNKGVTIEILNEFYNKIEEVNKRVLQISIQGQQNYK